MDARNLERDIEQFLAAHHVMTLATTGEGGVAHAASLMFAAEHLSLYWMSDSAARCRMRVTKHSVFADDLGNLGYQERLKHLEVIRSGARAYMVMCEAAPDKLPEREILDYNADEVFEGGSLIAINGDSWLELNHRVAAKAYQ